MSQQNQMQSEWQGTSYEGKLSMAPRRRNRGWVVALVTAVAIVVLLGVVLGELVTFAGNQQQTTALPTQTFAVSGQTTLVIKNDVGSISIQSGTSNSVSVTASKHITGLGTSLNDLNESATQNGDTITVTGTAKTQSVIHTGSEELNLTITMPSNGDIQIDTQAGKAEINSISGQLTVHARAADVSMSNVTLKGQSLVQAQAGKIDFNGSLDPQSNDLFKTEAGKIDVTLPANAAFGVKTSVNVGQVSNDFGSNDVGSAPRAQLEIDTNAGVIAIHKGS